MTNLKLTSLRQTSFLTALKVFVFAALVTTYSCKKEREIPVEDNSGAYQLGEDIDGIAAGDHCGKDVALSADGRIVAVSSYQNDGNGNASGQVRVFQYSGSSWTQQGSDIYGEAADNYSGNSLSLSSDGSTLAISANFNTNVNGEAAGHVRIFKNQGGTWTQMGADIDGSGPYHIFGQDVSLSENGNIVAIGAPYTNDNGTRSGQVKIYQYSSNSWNQIGGTINGKATEDASGWSVSLSNDGTRVAIGAFLNDGNGSNSGHVRVFEYASGSWSQLGADINGEAAGDNSGRSISLSADGTTVAIGARSNSDNGTNSGHVRVYRYGQSSWSQLGSDINGEASEDESGHSVALSLDGNLIAIGAPFNDGNGESAGHVRLFRLDGGTWAQIGNDIDGEAAGDQSGFSVALSRNGAMVAVGAIGNEEFGSLTGHVRVHQVP
jgi:hypothetical protein